MLAKTTNWDEYYAKPAPAARFTRKLSERKIIDLFRAHANLESPKIAELGGANSCFVEAVSAELSPSAYVAIDNNKFGLKLLEDRYGDAGVIRGRFGDARDIGAEDQSFDIVYSVGLIEHFDTADTARCIQSHFDLCKPGGLVLMTFPTPTMLYRTLRGAVEVAGQWRFHDERPLSFDEVETAASPSGALVHRSINWAIGLTQGYLAYQKH